MACHCIIGFDNTPLGCFVTIRYYCELLIMIIYTDIYSYSIQSLLKMWHFQDLIFAIDFVTIRIEVYFVKSPLLKSGIIWT